MKSFKSILINSIVLGILSYGCGVQDRIKPIPDRYIVIIGKGETVLVNNGPYKYCFGIVQDSNEANDVFQVRSVCASSLIEISRTDLNYLGKLDISAIESIQQEVRILSYPNEYCFGKVVGFSKQGKLKVDSDCSSEPIEVSVSEVSFIKSFQE